MQWVRDAPQTPAPCVHTELLSPCSLSAVLSSALTQTETSVLAHGLTEMELLAGDLNVVGKWACWGWLATGHHWEPRSRGTVPTTGSVPGGFLGPSRMKKFSCL